MLTLVKFMVTILDFIHWVVQNHKYTSRNRFTILKNIWKDVLRWPYSAFIKMTLLSISYWQPSWIVSSHFFSIREAFWDHSNYPGFLWIEFNSKMKWQHHLVLNAKQMQKEALQLNNALNQELQFLVKQWRPSWICVIRFL